MSSKKKEPENEAQVPENELPENEAAGAAAPEAEAAGAAQPPEAAEKPAEKQPEAPAPEALLKAEKDRYLRLLAEYDNYRKRSAKERESIFADVRADTVTRFLPVYDNLERALAQSTEDEAYRKGVALIMAQFREVLSKLGVTEIEAVGQCFDPNLHNAVMHEEDPERGENEIVQELQKGFRMGEKVIRFSMVKTVN